MATLLRVWRWRPVSALRCWRWKAISPLPEEASAAREAWLNAGGVIHAPDIVWPEDVDLIVDGLLGTGLNRAPAASDVSVAD